MLQEKIKSVYFKEQLQKNFSCAELGLKQEETQWKTVADYVKYLYDRL